MHAQQKAAHIAKALAPASKLAHGIAPEIVAEGQAILNYDTKKMRPNTALSLFQALLRRLKIPYMAKLRPRQMLTHPGNRGGLMVSGHEVHKKGGGERGGKNVWARNEDPRRRPGHRDRPNRG